MTVQEYMEETKKLKNEYGVRPHAICADGYAISLQGGTNCYSSILKNGESVVTYGWDIIEDEPFTDNSVYDTLEVGVFVNQIMSTGMEEEIFDNAPNAWCENGGKDLLCYMNMDIDTINKVLDLHGGLVGPDPERYSVYIRNQK